LTWEATLQFYTIMFLYLNLAAHYGIVLSGCQAAALLSVLQETKISLFKTRKCVKTILLLTVLCVDIMRHVMCLKLTIYLHSKTKGGVQNHWSLYTHTHTNTHKHTQYRSDNKSTHAEWVLDPNWIDIKNAIQKGKNVKTWFKI